MDVRMWGRSLITIQRVDRAAWLKLDIVSRWLIAARASVLAAMVAEWTAANSGLGYLIIDAGEQYRFPLMWAGIVAATALAVAAFTAAAFVERRVIWWPVETV